MRTIIHKKGNSYIRHAIHLTIAQKASGAHGRQKIKCIVQHISQFTSSRAAELWIVALLLLPQLLLCCGVVKLGQGFCHDLTRRMSVLSCSLLCLASRDGEVYTCFLQAEPRKSRLLKGRSSRPEAVCPASPHWDSALWNPHALPYGLKLHDAARTTCLRIPPRGGIPLRDSNGIIEKHVNSFTFKTSWAYTRKHTSSSGSVTELCENTRKRIVCHVNSTRKHIASHVSPGIEYKRCWHDYEKDRQTC